MASPHGVYIDAPIDKLAPNAWNYNHQDATVFRKLVASIKQNGFSQPVIARELPDGMLEIINGEHRWKAAKRLKMKQVPVFIVSDADDEKAKQLTIALNELSGSPDEDKLSDLLQELGKSSDVKALEAILPYSSQQLSEYLSRDDGETMSALKSMTSAQDEAPTETSQKKKEAPAGQVKVLKFQLSPSVHAQMSTKLAEIGRDPSVILVQAITSFHEHEMHARALKKAKAKEAVKKLGAEGALAAKKKSASKKKAPAKKRVVRRRKAQQE